jgi:O-antigen ligase
MSYFSRRWEAFSLFAVCAMAVCVSLGAALIGLSKVLVLVAVLGRMRVDGWGGVRSWLRQAPQPVFIILVAILLFACSAAWTEADGFEALRAFWRHSRLIWLIAVLYLIRQSTHAWRVLSWFAVGQIGVVLMSWLMWMGVPIPFATATDYPLEYGILFTSTLEQPVMETLLAVLLWHFRSRWRSQLEQGLAGSMGKYVIYAMLGLTVANVLLIMSGRTGYLVMFVFLVLLLWTALPRNLRAASLVLPVLVAILLFYFSPRFHDRVMQVRTDVVNYQQGDINSSQGLRLEMWRVSLDAARDKPWWGHGVGSYPKVYVAYHGRDKGGASNSHQQYLFWLVEFGLVGLGLLLAFFASLMHHARQLPDDVKGALRATVAIAAVMSLANCPFYGVGMGEFFLLMMASLSAMRENDNTVSIGKEACL